MTEPARMVGVTHDGLLLPIHDPACDSVRGMCLWGLIVAADYVEEFKEHEDYFREVFSNNTNQQPFIMFMADRGYCRFCGR